MPKAKVADAASLAFERLYTVIRSRGAKVRHDPTLLAFKLDGWYAIDQDDERSVVGGERLNVSLDGDGYLRVKGGTAGEFVVTAERYLDILDGR